MKDKITSFSTWAQKNWLGLVIVLLCLMMLFICAVMASWLYGYWSNALAGTRFELSSCWQGVGVVVTGLGGVASMAGVCWAKYNTDSKLNSPPGERPSFTKAVESFVKR